jgi:uncharacterized protein
MIRTQQFSGRLLVIGLLITGLLFSLVGPGMARPLSPTSSLPHNLAVSALTAAHITVSQVYGGGGNAGATYTHDFIELYNPTASPVSLSGWSVQYASAGGSTWAVTPLSGTLQPGKHYLIQQAAGAGGTTPLPTPDAVGSTAMSATAGKVALVSSTTALTGACPIGGSIVDFVGFGTTASCYEGSGPTPAPSNTNAALRLGSGATDTNNNAADFVTGAPNPRNQGFLPAASLTLSQIYGGGGNSGAAYKNDFIELYNPTASPVSLSGWSVQYASATGSSWQVTPLSGTLQPGNHYLIQQAAGAGGTIPLPYPDAVGTIPMSATAGKVALVSSTTTLSGTCPTGGSIVDFVGYGGANCFEGSGPTAALSNTTAALRKEAGAVDTNDNASDFVTGAPNPRSQSDQPPAVSATTPAAGAGGVSRSANLSVQFSEPVDIYGNWYTISCSESGAVSALASGGPETFILDPHTDFAYGETCSVTIYAAQVSDQDLDDPPDNMLADYVFSFITEEPPACGLPATLIHQVQGSGPTSPLVGSTVTVEAVVTASYQGTDQLSGYYIQEEDEDQDGDPATSEGIFVFNTSYPVSPGQLVRLTGRVTEFSIGGGGFLTQLSGISSPEVCGEDFTVTPSLVSLPVASLADWEAYEGMLVTIPQLLTVTETFTLGRFGEVSLSVNGRLYNPTHLVPPGAPALALQDLNDRSRILLDDGNGQQNIDPTIHPPGGLSAANTLRSGYTVDGLTGVIEQRFSVYRMQPVGQVEFLPTNPRQPEPASAGGQIQVASFNVLNYFNGDGLGYGFPTSRGANSPLEFQRQRDKIIAAVTRMDAEIIGLMELENDAPPYSAIEDLVAGLNAATAPGTYAFIDTGIIGSDEIRVGIIYKPALVSPVGSYAVLNSSVDPLFDDTRSRPVLAQTFEVNLTGARLTVAVNHLKSKGSACAGDPDQFDGQGNCNLTRTRAATALVNWLATDPTASGDPDFLIIGDLNAYAQEDPITAIRNAGYTNLLEAFHGPSAYSYVFSGQSGYLDHALSNASLTPQVAGVTEWHINADEPIVMDYNVEFKTTNHINTLYDPGPFRSSDHDPVIIGLNLNAPPTLDAGGPYYVVEGEEIVLLALGLDPDDDPLTYWWDLDNDGIFETPGQMAVFSAFGLTAPASYTVRVQARDPSGHTVVAETQVFILYPFSGVYAPLANPPEVNPVNAGSTAPVKFSLFGYRGMDILVPPQPVVSFYNCQTGAPMTPGGANRQGGSLHYDPDEDQYVYTLRTQKSWAGACGTLNLALNDGATYPVYFSFTR